MRQLPSLAFLCGAALLAVAPAFPAVAGTLEVNPVLVQIDADRRTGTVTVRNVESQPVTIRAEALEWRQADGGESYEESDAVIVSPPIFTIPGGGTQLVRVGLRRPSDAPQAYRLIIEEVPAANPGGGIRVALRLNLPLHVMMDPADPAGVTWSAMRDAEGGWTIEAVNPGTGYVRLDSEMARQATGITHADTIHFGTLLPGATRRWQIGSNPQISDPATFGRIQKARRDAAALQGSH